MPEFEIVKCPDLRSVIDSAGLVFIEQRAGKINPASLQMFTAANELAASTGGDVHAVIIGEDVGDLTERIGAAGAKVVHVIDDPELRFYRAMPYTSALCAAIEAAQADIVLLATTSLGRDFAPRMAARAKAALATDCVEVALEADELRVKRPMYAAKCIGTYALASDRVRILSIRPNIYGATEEAEAAPTVNAIALDLTDLDKRARTVDVAATSEGVKDVT